MADSWLETFREVTSSTASLNDLHPLKLDRWHRELVELPDAVYMQLGCTTLFHQVDVAAQALRQMVELLGADNLPTGASEIARRNIGSFSWHVPAAFVQSGTLPFTVVWDKDSSSWKLTSGALLAINTTKTVPDVDAAVEKALAWLEELEAEHERRLEELHEADDEITSSTS
jgi:hypothetical protein